MKLMGNITKESRNISGVISPRAGGGRVKDVTYDGDSVVNEEGVAIIPPYPSVPVTDVKYNNQSIVNENGVAIIPNLNISVLTNQISYNALSENEKKNGKIYFLHDTQPHYDYFNMYDFYNRSEGSVSITISSGILKYVYNGGITIGAESFYNIQIPKEINRIYFKCKTGTCYNASNPKWHLTIGVKETYNTNIWIYSDDSNWLAKYDSTEQNTTIESYLDLSSVNVDSYLQMCAHGWNVEFEYFGIENGTEDLNKIMFMDYEF